MSVAEFSALFGGASVADLGATGLLVLVVLGVLTGRLVPGKVLKEARDAFAAREAVYEEREKRLLEEVESWRTAHSGQREANAALGSQVGELLDLARTSTSILRAWQVATGGAVLPEPKDE